jgi:hypothetical protein
VVCGADELGLSLSLHSIIRPRNSGLGGCNRGPALARWRPQGLPVRESQTELDIKSGGTPLLPEKRLTAERRAAL